jgi:hypothetical protein
LTQVSFDDQVYDPETSYQAASTYTFTGILSTSSLPAIDDQDEMDERDSSSTSVPTLHVLNSPYSVYPLQSASIATEADADREEVLDQLNQAFGVDDRLSAEFLLLALISSVTTRVPGGIPLGSLSLNLLLPKDPDTDLQAFKRIVETISTVSPLVSPVELSIELISKGSFYPSMVNAAGSTGLQSGVLQLAPSTVVVMNEDTLEGGDLKDRAVDNLKALINVFKMQKLQYKYPFVGEDFGMDVDLDLIVVGQGKSFLPVSRMRIMIFLWAAFAYSRNRPIRSTFTCRSYLASLQQRRNRPTTTGSRRSDVIFLKRVRPPSRCRYLTLSPNTSRASLSGYEKRPLRMARLWERRS